MEEKFIEALAKIDSVKFAKMQDVIDEDNLKKELQKPIPLKTKYMKEIKEEQKQQLLNLNDSRVNEILGINKLEDNTWYIYNDGYLQFNVKNGVGYGLDVNEWYECAKWIKYKANGEYRKATHEEVENALIKEAKRRGFKDGVKFKSSLSEDGRIRTFSTHNEIFYSPDNNSLHASTKMEEWNRIDGNQSNPAIFKNGKWAEVIEQKPNKQEIINQINELLNLL